MVTAATEDEAKALAAQRALDGELTWQIQDNNVWRLCPGLALLLDTYRDVVWITIVRLRIK